ncbi:MAG: YeeE/YedE family protein [Kiritimatiellaeota bacterium]|nr:YeeE/YedE family protein [Kiritimatiellota bacterium]
MILKFFTGKWSSYLAGACIAVLFVFALYVLNSPVGMSNAYLMISEYCRETINARTVKELPFLDWQTGFLLGIFIGAMITAIVSGNWRLRLIPEGGGRGVVASAGVVAFTGFAGGFLVMLGLQLAGDSFMGQWAAAIQLSTAAWVFFATVFVFGIVFTAITSARRKSSGSGGEKKNKDSEEKK